MKPAPVGYNVQSAVNTKDHLIVAHEVADLDHDRAQLAEMSVRAGKAFGARRISQR